MWPRKPAQRTPLALAHMVVVDLETTGLRANRDRLISIGAVTVRGHSLILEQSFERILRQESPSDPDNILIHRIGAGQQLGGVEPAAALRDFQQFVGDSPLIAYRAPFDAEVLRREFAMTLGQSPHWPFVDLAVTLQLLWPETRANTLDAWAERFQLPILRRHHAVADALVTAQLLLIALSRLEALGWHTLEDLLNLEKRRRWLTPHSPAEP
jgi:DNA polymerase III subunit epsilon